MKKLISLIIILCLTISLCACGNTAPKAESTPSPTPEPEPVVTEQPAAEEPSPTPAPPVETPVPAWQEPYRTYLTANFSPLANACGGYIAGVGFIDLDLDTVPEMLIFDPGAALSMGVQIFDLINGQVQLITASSVEVGSTFGSSYFSPELYVNANSFSDFRMKEAPDGQLYFEVNSVNGDADFHYSEIIRFSCGDNSALQLSSVACAQTSIDPETNAEEYTVYTAGSAVVDEAGYINVMTGVYRATDLQYEASGAFFWESELYGQDITGFTAMLNAALESYIPAV